MNTSFCQHDQSMPRFFFLLLLRLRVGAPDQGGYLWFPEYADPIPKLLLALLKNNFHVIANEKKRISPVFITSWLLDFVKGHNKHLTDRHTRAHFSELWCSHLLMNHNKLISIARESWSFEVYWMLILLTLFLKYRPILTSGQIFGIMKSSFVRVYSLSQLWN